MGGRTLVVGFVAGKIEKMRVAAFTYKDATLSIGESYPPLNLVLLKNVSILGVHCGSFPPSVLYLIQLSPPTVCDFGVAPPAVHVRSSEAGGVSYFRLAKGL